MPKPLLITVQTEQTIFIKEQSVLLITARVSNEDYVLSSLPM